MKKSLMGVLAFMLAISIVGCTTKTSNKKSNQSVETSDKSIETKDGFYSGFLSSSKKDECGKKNDEGILDKIIYHAEVKDNRVIINGVFGYKEDEELEKDTSISDNSVHKFKITSKTIFQGVGGDEGPEKMSQDEFEDTLKQCLDSGIGFEVEVKNGNAKTVSIVS